MSGLLAPETTLTSISLSSCDDTGESILITLSFSGSLVEKRNFKNKKQRDFFEIYLSLEYINLRKENTLLGKE